MLQALWSASSGMLAQQMSMDTVANNIANVNTPGYKKTRVEFQDLLYSQMRSPDRVTRNGQVVSNGIQVGNGTRAAATQMLFEQGSLQPTGNAGDLALTGNAFFEVLLPDGSKAYTRDGSFKVDADGYLVTGNGELVNMEAGDGGLLTFPEGVSKINVNPEGIIFRDKQLLQVEQYTFATPGELQQVEPGMFRPTDKSGEATLVSDLQNVEPVDLTDAEGNPLPPAEKPAPPVYYQVTLEDGDTAYTTQTSFKVDAEGRLVTIDKEYPLEPEVVVDLAQDGPLKAGDVVSPDKDGNINVPAVAGKLNIVRFTNPAGLQKTGSNLYVQTANSGTPQAARDYSLVQGTLEMSNVQLAEEMVNMITANRAYDLNSRSIKTSDDMLGMANALLRR